MPQIVWDYRVWYLRIDWFDLPKLTTITFGYNSFVKAESIYLKSTFILFSSLDVPFSNGECLLDDSEDNETFKSITSFDISSDSASINLKNCILNPYVDELSLYDDASDISNYMDSENN